MIYRIMGFLLLIETAMLMCCGGVSLFYKEDDLNSFLLSSAITAFVGVIMLAIGRGAEKSLNRRDGYVIVSVAWIAFSFFGMLPYYIGGYIPSVTDAFFETMSGFSSTGATIMNNIESMPHGILFWRAMTQWIGGLGIVFFTIAVLPIFGMGGIQVFAAEASGPTHDKVHPRIGVTAKWIWGIYAGMTGTLIILLVFGGHGTFRQYLPRFHHDQYRWVLHQADKYRILPLALHRLCNICFHVPLGSQLHAIIADVQWENKEVYP